MSKPAARIGDMHVCPMLTPGLPPIPHVGGPIVGPGVPTVLVGGAPASVMGDMCVCVGPPDSIILGSTGVLIGGKPAARMGDMTVHGGSIVLGCPTVLIGEVSPQTVPLKASMALIQQMPAGAATAAKQALAMQQAAEEGKPFCEECETEETPLIYNLQWIKKIKTDDGEKEIFIRKVRSGKKVILRAHVQDIDDGEEITFKVQTTKGLDGKKYIKQLTGTVRDKMVEVEWKAENKASN